MSRSCRAWTEGRAVLRDAVCGGGRLSTRAKPADDARFGRRRRLGTARSLSRLCWLVVVAVLPFSVGPPPCVAAATGSADRRAAVSHIDRTPQARESVPAGPHGLDPVRADRLRVGVLAGVGLLTLGSGYDSPGGARSVRALQRQLAALGLSPGPIDGRYGPLTEAAVIHFQAVQGLAVDGIAGRRTLAALAGASPTLYPGSGSVPGGSGLVRVLQRRLVADGFAPGPLDGRYGPLTESAVVRFQIAHGLLVDGIAGPQTLAHLGFGAGPRPVHRLTGSARWRAAATRVPGIRAALQPRGHGEAGGWSWLLFALLAGLLAGSVGVVLSHVGRRRRGRLPSALIATRDRPPASAASPHDRDAPSLHDRYAPRPDDREAPRPHNPGATCPRVGERADSGEAARLGAVLAQRGKPAAAEAAYRYADRHGDPEAAFQLGVLLAERGDLVGAKTALERGDERGHPRAAYKLGVLLEEQSELVAAQAAYGRADQRGDPDGAHSLGLLLAQRGDLSGAKAALQRAEQHGHPEAARKLGLLLEERGDLEGAEAAFQRADQHGDAIATFNLGALREQRGDLRGAIGAFRRAALLEREPADGILRDGRCASASPEPGSSDGQREPDTVEAGAVSGVDSTTG